MKRVIIPILALTAACGGVSSSPPPDNPQPSSPSVPSARASGATLRSPSFTPSDNAAIAKASACGIERWHVKTGTDPDAGKVNTTAVPSNIATLAGLAAPVSPPDRRTTQAEFTVFSILATVTSYKTEADSDVHLALTDANGHTMIAEIPAPKCVAKTSPFYSDIATARATWDAMYPETPSYVTVHQTVTLQGVGFYDRLHGQRGVAPNGIELHPLLNIALH